MGKEILERGKYGVKTPLLPILPSSLIERLFSKGIKRGEAPLRISLPSPLMKGRGIKGEGLVNHLLLREGGQGDRLLDNLLKQS